MHIIGFVFVMLICWAVFAIGPYLDRRNLPPVLYGQTGENIIFAISTVITVSIGSALVWVFLSMEWPHATVLVVFAFLASQWTYRIVPGLISETAMGLFLWTVFLLAMNLLVWTMLRPHF